MTEAFQLQAFLIAAQPFPGLGNSPSPCRPRMAAQHLCQLQQAYFVLDDFLFVAHPTFLSALLGDCAQNVRSHRDQITSRVEHVKYAEDFVHLPPQADFSHRLQTGGLDADSNFPRLCLGHISACQNIHNFRTAYHIAPLSRSAHANDLLRWHFARLIPPVAEYDNEDSSRYCVVFGKPAT